MNESPLNEDQLKLCDTIKRLKIAREAEENAPVNPDVIERVKARLRAMYPELNLPK